MPSILLPIKPVGLGAPRVRRLPGGGLEEPREHRLDPVNETTVAWAADALASGRATAATAVAIGTGAAETALRAARARGCEQLLRIDLPAAATALDVGTVAALIAAAAERTGADVVALGCESLDASGGVVPAAVAATLGWPLVSRAREADLAGGAPPAGPSLAAAQLVARCDDGELRELPLPAVVSFAEGGVAVRAPRLAQVIAARTAPIATVTAFELLGDRPPATWSDGIVDLEPVPPRAPATRMVPAADGTRELLAAIAAAGASR